MMITARTMLVIKTIMERIIFIMLLLVSENNPLLIVAL